MRDAIRTGRLVAGERLPSSRELARALGLSRGPVQDCYVQLQAEGYLVTRVGSARRVAAGAHVPPAPASAHPAAPRLIAGFRHGVPVPLHARDHAGSTGAGFRGCGGAGDRGGHRGGRRPACRSVFPATAPSLETVPSGDTPCPRTGRGPVFRMTPGPRGSARASVALSSVADSPTLGFARAGGPHRVDSLLSLAVARTEPCSPTVVRRRDPKSECPERQVLVGLPSEALLVSCAINSSLVLGAPLPPTWPNTRRPGLDGRTTNPAGQGANPPTNFWRSALEPCPLQRHVQQQPVLAVVQVEAGELFDP
ncbi:GntR family transcriptional regulator [Streptomyces sp. NBC_00996]|uniref:GntR family transcriptional regulator n=1 Tax=Streptomyces sp. NBC_00996 TaxID=2903710 RepID=UPI003870C8CC|nr:winged helix-turn-helix domain-containing protein [Streptomyces sp. NBC_00996]